MTKTGKLELTWIGKYETKKTEPRILVEDKSKSNTLKDVLTKNMLIHGDNLLALKALEQEFSGKIKCVYIDPPYNTGSAFTHYDDGLEHSIWLSIMKSRLEILKNLMTDDGSIWISIDDDEGHYLKVLCDEIFGRNNFINTVIWEKKYSPQNDAKWLSDSHDFILVYAKNKQIWRPNLLPRTDEMNKRYKNIDNDPRGLWKPGDMSAKRLTPKDVYEITTPSGRKVMPPSGYSWRLSKESFQEYLNDNRIWFGPSGNSVPAIKRFLTEVKDGLTAMTIWKYQDVGHNQDAKKEVVIFNSDDVFDTPKPEKLLQKIVHLATKKGDYILDSFLGSGTTASVAHKMNRKWIGIELGNHAYTHCKVRLDKVIEGEQGGISTSVNWLGGGGYRFYELAPSLLERHLELPIYQVNKDYTFEMLCEAICKLEGFKYEPQGEMHGRSSETRFIHIASDMVTGEYVKQITKELGENDSVLIYGTKIQSNLRLPDNIEIKRIPKDLLKKYDFESEIR